MTPVVENKPGGGTVVATQEVARAPATPPPLLMVSNSFTINPSLHASLPYDIFRDFRPVALAAAIPHVLVVSPAIPARTVAEFLALARARPGEFHFATPGIGTSNHLNTELFARRSGASFTHVPYRGFAQWFPDLLANRVQFVIGTVTELIGPARDGQVRILAVAQDARLPSLPDVPALGEDGGPAVASSSWFGFVAPASVPAATRDRLEAAMLDSLRVPEAVRRLQEMQIMPAPRGGDAFAAFLREEHANYAEAIRISGARVD
ncbi:Bug family tripartite tricarboxylate transporter substrate binding protein [Falsiroseomonas ponticola]|uniref:Bug family tripartite tricarboxylate transporter substrate binding protein n=1 Tax=Falsiroseomonas ponticola TaxID=2786951 RepID=UPI001931FEA0|nr:tripartite tricarboxylate transporter substrate-binding protein [Roseomonas ponticola]